MPLRALALLLTVPVVAAVLAWALAAHGDHRGARPVTAVPLPARWRQAAAGTAVGPQTGRVRWRRRLEGPVVPGPVVASGGVVLAASNAGVLHAIDLATGRDRWRFDGRASYGSDLSTAPAVLRDGTVLWPGPRETLFALDRDGTPLWQLRMHAMPLSPAQAPGGEVIVSDQSGWVRAIELRRGRPRVRWQLQVKGPSYGAPAVARDGTVYVTAGERLVAIRAGRVLWRFAARALSEVSPVVAADGTIVFGSNDESEYGVAPDGRLRWRHRIGALTYSSPAATPGGLVYFGDHHGVVSALDARGRLVARVAGLQPTPQLRSVGVWTRPLVDARHDVYFGTRPGHIYGFAPSGRRLFDIDTGATVDSYPALAGDGTLLIGSENGRLYAIGRPPQPGGSRHSRALRSAAAPAKP